MSADEQQALRALIEVPAPAPTTTLEVVLRRGRARVRVRQAGSVLAVVVVVGLLGALVAWIQVPAHRLPAATPHLAGEEVGWPRAALPAKTGATPWQRVGPHPATLSVCPSSQVGAVPTGIGDTAEATLQSVRDLLVATVRDARIGYWTDLDPAVHRYSLDITDADGVGSVDLMTSAYSTDPGTAADTLAFTERNCLPPKRAVLTDSSVAQVYPVAPDGDQSIRLTARLFRPDGRMLVVVVRSRAGVPFGSWDRGTLPLSEQQLAQTALRLAAVG
ncbi:hypothetical protein [Actinokineospora sp. NBRC 105648]|uniref:hypothetical protein n=1 Tax=Actinokineospora sp. NBRC 105648 TaxID=3032206 RepID=UPI0024A42E45|nr:hypothetical protein [Actinokineospora sp. NBRC 105648]GLZ41251.1 hypothetical protein Acsp05_48750 [Actinokineospora sp. NBRC 105648]